MNICLIWIITLKIMSLRSIHVVEKENNIFFFLVAKYYSIAYLYHVFFIHLSIDRHWISFRILAIVNNDAMSGVLHTSLQYPVLISFGCLPRSEVDRSYNNSIFGPFDSKTFSLISWGTSILFSMVAALM